MRSAAVARSSPTLIPPRATCLVAGRIYQKWSHHANLRADISFRLVSLRACLRRLLPFALFFAYATSQKTREKRFFFDFFLIFCLICFVALVAALLQLCNSPVVKIEKIQKKALNNWLFF
jgi:hypothetical protein